MTELRVFMTVAVVLVWLAQAAAVTVGPFDRPVAQDDSHVRVEARSDAAWYPLDQHLPVGLKPGASVGTPVVTGTIAPFEVVLPDAFEVPVLPGLQEIRVTYAERSAGVGERVSPAILLVLAHGSGSSQTSVYSVPATPMEPERRVLSTSLLTGASLDLTVQRVAALAGVGGRHGRVFAGVGVFSPPGRRCIHLAELKSR